MKKIVLFVDDEPQILEGLRHRLHRQRDRWEMLFAESGRAALEILGREAVDVIVTDMRMPEMDGATLLKKVQDLYPQVVRIVLSGHADMETALRAVPVAHQFLAKPSDPGVIEHVIERACGLQLIVHDQLVKQIVGKIENLPTLPRVYSQLMVTLANDNGTMEDVAGILKQDMAICAKVLQVVNSAFFRLSRSITDIEEAVAYLGLDTTKQIVLAVEVFQQGHGRKTPEGFSLEALQEHSLLVGELASSFVSEKTAKEDAFVAGLLHDIGKLLLAVEVPDHMEKVLLEMRNTGNSMHDTEERIWGVSHAEVGGYLLGIWGLPYPIIDAVANHHAPGRTGSGVFTILSAVYIANTLVHDLVDDRGAQTEVAGLDSGHVEQLGAADRIQDCQRIAQLLLKKRSRSRG